MRFLFACIVLLFAFSTVAISDVSVVQQKTVVGSPTAIDNQLGVIPNSGCTFIAIISHPSTTYADDVSGDDGAIHLHKMSWTYNSGVVVEVWKANGCLGQSPNFHVGLVGPSQDGVMVNFSEWSQ